MNHDLLEQCREALAAARRAGADDAEAYAQHGEVVSAVVEKNDLQMTRVQDETVFGIRAFVGERVGFASTNHLEEIEPACREAVTLAKAAPRDAANALPNGQEVEPVDGIYDPASSDFTAAQAVERAIEILELAGAIDRRVVIGDAEFTAKRGEIAIANTRGVAAGERSAIFFHSVLATARDGDVVSNMDFQFGSTRRLAAIDVAPAVRRACANALDSLGASAGISFRGAVLLSPQSVEAMVVPFLLFQLNGRNVLRRQSRWGESIGQPVATSQLTLVDDALLPGGAGSSAFDREGVPHAPRTLIEQGILRSLLHNAYSSAALSQADTAHAAGSARSIPGIGSTNLAILPGPVTREDLLADTRRGLLVTRFSGNVDPVSGDFSGVAKGAQLIENGKATRPVRGTLIAGNLFDRLRTTSGITRERETIHSLTLPTIRLDDVSVTASLD
jgi:PmbA protein